MRSSVWSCLFYAAGTSGVAVTRSPASPTPNQRKKSPRRPRSSVDELGRRPPGAEAACGSVSSRSLKIMGGCLEAPLPRAGPGAVLRAHDERRAARVERLGFQPRGSTDEGGRATSVCKPVLACGSQAWSFHASELGFSVPAHAFWTVATGCPRELATRAVAPILKSVTTHPFVFPGPAC